MCAGMLVSKETATASVKKIFDSVDSLVEENIS